MSDFVTLALRLQHVVQAEVDGVVHHSLNWSTNYGGTTQCGIKFNWVDGKPRRDPLLAETPLYEETMDRIERSRASAKRIRGDATCIACIAIEEDDAEAL